MKSRLRQSTTRTNHVGPLKTTTRPRASSANQDRHSTILDYACAMRRSGTLKEKNKTTKVGWREENRVRSGADLPAISRDRSNRKETQRPPEASEKSGEGEESAWSTSSYFARGALQRAWIGERRRTKHFKPGVGWYIKSRREGSVSVSRAVGGSPYFKGFILDHRLIDERGFCHLRQTGQPISGKESWLKRISTG